MGACCGATLDENTRYINERLASEERIQNNMHKLLFLGPGGSGKSTIFKQLQWLHGDGFTDDDAIMLKEHIYCQIVQQMKMAIKHYLPQYANSPVIALNNQSAPPSLATATETATATSSSQQSTTTTATATQQQQQSDTSPPEIDLNELDLEKAISIVQNHGDVTIFNMAIAESIKYIWCNEEMIKNAFIENDKTSKNKSKILDETTEYFWNDIDRIKDENYKPNKKDIIHVRYRTTGIIEKKFKINNGLFHIFDVGGQKSERKKWIQQFDEVQAVIFVISLSCFNEMMYEDFNKNCMVDSLELFDEICNHKAFTETHIILFLNKRDLFRKKIAQIPITACEIFSDFEQYQHDSTIHSNAHDYEQTTAYIKAKFESLCRNERKQIYTHLTCAMDQTNIDAVFNDVKHIVITQNLFNEGLS